MAYNPFCDDAADDISRVAYCNPEEEGAGIYHAALVKKGTVIDKSTPDTYRTSLLAAETACNAYILRNIYGNYDGGTAQFGKSYGGATPKKIGGEHTTTLADPQYVGNEDFWNSMSDRAAGYNLHMIGQTRAWEIDKPLTVTSKGAIVEDFKEIIEGEITIKWNDRNNPVSVPFNREGIETYPTLTTGALVNNGTATINGYTITEAAAAAIDVEIPVTGAVSYALAAGSSLPTGLAFDTETGVLSGSVATEGTYTFVLTGSNACGITGGKEITLIIT